MIRERQPVVMVTGASAGVDRAIVRSFARQRGATLGLLARGRQRLDDAVRDVQSLGEQAIALPADVADADAVELAAQALEERVGPIDIWVNNAMATMMAPFRRMTLAEFHRVIEVTFFGYVHGTHAALRRMLPRDRGVIVQVGSATAAVCAAVGAVDRNRSTRNA